MSQGPRSALQSDRDEFGNSFTDYVATRSRHLPESTRVASPRRPQSSRSRPSNKHLNTDGEERHVSYSNLSGRHDPGPDDRDFVTSRTSRSPNSRPTCTPPRRHSPPSRSNSRSRHSPSPSPSPRRRSSMPSPSRRPYGRGSDHSHDRYSSPDHFGVKTDYDIDKRFADIERDLNIPEPPGGREDAQTRRELMTHGARRGTEHSEGPAWGR